MKDLQDQLHNSNAIFRLFSVEERTGLIDFLPALHCVDQRLEKYDQAKGSAWCTQSVDTHLVHAVGHLSRAMTEMDHIVTCEKELTAFILRGLMALTLLRKRDGLDSLSTSRASTR